MYRNTRFGDLMKGLPRGLVERAAMATGADKHNKGFSSWDHLLAMIYAHLSGSTSLRSLTARFNSHKAQHYHLGTHELRRSTLADANRKRPTALFETIVGQLLQQANRRVRKECQDLMYLLDSTPIALKGTGYAWAEAGKTPRTTGLKLHLLYAPQARLPVYSHITAPNVNDIEEAWRLPLETGATYVFDKAYCDYNWWQKIDGKGAYFVTRFKANASLVAIEQRAIPESAQALILEDTLVRFKNRHPGGGRINRYEQPLRRVVVHRPDKARPLVLATNDLTSSAEDIAACYKARWGIELYFKWIKQHLKIKRFLGRSENAVRIQILTALVAYLLVAIYHRQQACKTSLHLFVEELSATLFHRLAVEAYIVNRYQRRRRVFEERQGALNL